MHSQQGLKKVLEEIKKHKWLCQIAPHGIYCIIGILLYNSFIVLLGSNQIFGEKQGLF